jgi:iron complex transport system substrate-binding protein
VELAGIEDPLGRAGIPSAPGSWADVAAARPELLIIAPCGFTKKRAEAEAAQLQSEIRSTSAACVVVLDGSAYFNRPGPRLVDSLEVLVASRPRPQRQCR